MIRLPRRWILLVLVPTFLVAVGTVGYTTIEGWHPFDALYMTIITLSTIGYGEIPRELSTHGRVFTIFLILGGVFSLGYAMTEAIRIVVSGEVAEILGKRKMENALANLNNHIIVCGYGRIGRLVCAEFARLNRPFVVIDAVEAEFKEFPYPTGIPLVGDANSDEILRKAGIERAHSLVAVMASDADNLFTTMSARLLNAKLNIVARVEDAPSEQKLLRAGANRVVSPYQIGGTRVAHAVVKPTVVDFIDLTSRTEHIELQMEESKVEQGSMLVGRSLRDSRLGADHHVIIVAIKKPSGKMSFNPAPETMLEAGDILVAMGSRDHLANLEKLARTAARRENT
jgi:voltage-gated potassium channel